MFRKLQFPHLRHGNSPWGSQWQKIFLLLGSLGSLISTSHLQSTHLSVSALPDVSVKMSWVSKELLFPFTDKLLLNRKSSQPVMWAANGRGGKLSLGPEGLVRLRMWSWWDKFSHLHTKCLLAPWKLFYFVRIQPQKKKKKVIPSCLY